MNRLLNYSPYFWISQPCLWKKKKQNWSDTSRRNNMASIITQVWRLVAGKTGCYLCLTLKLWTRDLHWNDACHSFSYMLPTQGNILILQRATDLVNYVFHWLDKQDSKVHFKDLSKTFTYGRHCSPQYQLRKKKPIKSFRIIWLLLSIQKTTRTTRCIHKEQKKQQSVFYHLNSLRLLCKVINGSRQWSL